MAKKIFKAFYKHDVTARHDPKHQSLIEQYRAEGEGIYYLLLENIGEHHAGTFKLKILGINAEADERFQRKCESSASFARIPVVALNLLANDIGTSEERLKDVLNFATRIECRLFDKSLWLTYSILYSSGFRKRLMVGKKSNESGKPDKTTRPSKLIARLRAFVRRRDSFTCQRCNKTTEENNRSLDVIYITDSLQASVQGIKMPELAACPAGDAGRDLDANGRNGHDFDEKRTKVDKKIGSLFELSKSCISLCRMCSYKIIGLGVGHPVSTTVVGHV